MSKLRTKQILDFVSDVQAGMDNYLTTAASNADSTVLSSAKSYADVAEADGLTAAKAYTDARELVIEGEYSDADSVALAAAKAYTDARELVIEGEYSAADSVALAAAKAYTDARELVIEGEYSTADSVVLSSAKAYSDLQKDRIDILLDDSDAALDTFKEISDFLGSLDTADISGLSAMISTGDSQTLSSAVTADSVVLSSAKDYTDARELVIEGEYSAADSVALAAAKAYTDARELVIEGEYSAADVVILAAAKTYADGLVSGVDYFEEEGKLITQTTFSTATLFDETVDAEVDVFINGLQIHRFPTVAEGEELPEGAHGWRFNPAGGNQFEIVNLGYTLDERDHVIVSGKKK